MRIACLQFAPKVGDVDNNLNRADAVLNKTDPEVLESLDLLVLPEMAFSGYNFKSLQHIAPFLEPSGSGISSLWARTTALKHNTKVLVGYPEKVDIAAKWPTSPEYYDSAIMVNEDGETVLNYRKNFLYNVDETWALENTEGFYGDEISNLGITAIGICMDLNPYRFQTPWHAFEFAFHILESEANLVIVTMAWLTREEPRKFSRTAHEPDMETLAYWVERLEPVIRAELDEEVIIVFCNRCGRESDALYAGTSAVIGIKDGEVNVYGLAGRGTKELLIADTSQPPLAKLIQRSEVIDAADEVDLATQKGDKQDGNPLTSFQHWSPEDTTQFASPIPLPEDTKTALQVSDSRQIHPVEKLKEPQLSDQPSPPRDKKPKKERPLPKILIPETLAQRSNSGSKTTTVESPNIPTPSAPTPTPAAVRPKLIIPETQPRHQHKATPYPHDRYSMEQMRFFGEMPPQCLSPITAITEPDSQAAKYYRFPETAQTTPLDCTFQPLPLSPSNFGSKLIQSSAMTSTSTYPTGPDITVENLRCPNPVEPDYSTNSSKLPDSSRQKFARPYEIATASTSTRDGKVFPLAMSEPRPSSSKSRNASKAREEPRRQAPASYQDHDAVSERMENLSLTRQDSRDLSNTPSQPCRPESPKSRNVSRNRRRFYSDGSITDPKLDERLAGLGRHTIPIAVSPSIVGSSSSGEPAVVDADHASPGRGFSTDDGTLKRVHPGHSPSHHIRSRSASRHVEERQSSHVRKMSKTDVGGIDGHARSRIPTRADSLRNGSDGSRPVSRGRQRLSDRRPSATQPATRSVEGHRVTVQRRSSGRRRQSSTNSTITFTRYQGVREATPQDEIIAVEEYIDPKCQKHSQRGPSFPPRIEAPSTDGTLATAKLDSTQWNPPPPPLTSVYRHQSKYDGNIRELSMFKAPSPFPPFVFGGSVTATILDSPLSPLRPNSDPGNFSLFSSKTEVTATTIPRSDTPQLDKIWPVMTLQTPQSPTSPGGMQTMSPTFHDEPCEEKAGGDVLTVQQPGARPSSTPW